MKKHKSKIFLGYWVKKSQFHRVHGGIREFIFILTTVCFWKFSFFLLASGMIKNHHYCFWTGDIIYAYNQNLWHHLEIFLSHKRQVGNLGMWKFKENDTCLFENQRYWDKQNVEIHTKNNSNLTGIRLNQKFSGWLQRPFLKYGYLYTLLRSLLTWQEKMVIFKKKHVHLYY